MKATKIAKTEVLSVHEFAQRLTSGAHYVSEGATPEEDVYIAVVRPSSFRVDIHRALLSDIEAAEDDIEEEGERLAAMPTEYFTFITLRGLWYAFKASDTYMVEPHEEGGTDLLDIDVSDINGPPSPWAMLKEIMRGNRSFGVTQEDIVSLCSQLQSARLGDE